MRITLSILFALLLSPLAALPAADTPKSAAKPNFIVINIDDLGYADIGPFGSKLNRTPNLDRMAREGRKLTCFYAAPVCSPSRAALMTGCYPKRVLPIGGVLFPAAAVGLNPVECTVAKVLKNAGYATACIGKWHLGDQPEFLPTRHGFDYYLGIPYSNDMGRAEDGSKSSLGEKLRKPRADDGPPDDEMGIRSAVRQPPTPLVENEQVIARVKQDELQGIVERYTVAAVKFIKANREKPFFLYLPHTAVHGPTYPGKRFAGNSPHGIHSDWIEEVDWSVGQVLDTLRELQLDEKTLVIFTSDNGGTTRSVNGPLRGFKGTTWEGGMRVPTIAWWPSRIPAGTSSDKVTGMFDVLPTFAKLGGGKVPADRKIDGGDIWPVLAGAPGAKSPHEVFYFFRGMKLEGVRSGPWKLRLAAAAEPAAPEPANAQRSKVKAGEDQLYNLEADIGESKNAAAEHPDVMKRLRTLVDAMQDDLGIKDSGPGVRPLGRVANPQPLIGKDGKIRDGFGASTKTDNTSVQAIKPAGTRADTVIGAFEEKDWGGWTASGAAFPPAPYRPGDNKRFAAFEGAGIAWSGRDGVESVGTLLSPAFQIQRRFINFLVAGARDLPAKLGVELLVEGRVVRAASASEAKDPSHALYWRTWDVRDLAGRTARMRVNDQSATGGITVDSFSQSDTPKSVPSDATTLGAESHRPQFHYTALTGWLNDANGLLHYKGQWHLFHQYQPPDGARRGWGHAVSSDLLRWQRLPVAIAPGDEDSAFSGSGLVDWANVSGLKRGDDPPILLFYTLMPPTDSGRKGTQCLVFSTDGARTFEKFPDNPILRTPATRDRDPKVFWHAPTRAWIMVLSLSRNNADRDNATYGLFRSKDLKSWELIQEIGPGAWYWECPDMFELPLDGDTNRTKWLLVKGSGDYIVGTFDGNRFQPETKPIRTHWGGNFYGAQTFSDAPGGRRVQIGWMSTGKEKAANAYPGMPFNQQMSFPREWTLRMTPEGPRLFRQPVAEIEKLYTKTHDLKPRLLEPGDNALAGISHDLLDIELEFDPREAAQVSLNLRGEEILYDVKAKKLTAFERTLSLVPVDGRLALRILLDRTSIELFGNRRAVTHSGVFFPDPANHRLTLTVRGGAARVERLVVRELKSIWPDFVARQPRYQP